MKSIKHYITIFFALLAIGALAQKAPDAVFHKITKEYTIHKDGSYDFHYYKKLELNTLFAFNRLYGETFVIYNPKYQSLKINSSYTITKNGKKVLTPKNAFNEILPDQAKNFPAYNNIREMVITHTAIEPGATIYLDYTIKTKKDFIDGFSLSDNLIENSPITDMEIIIKTPKGYDLNHKVLNLRTGPEVKESRKGTEYRWTFKNLKPIPREGYVDMLSEPQLLVQKHSDIKEAVRAELDIKNYSFELPEALSCKVATITKKSKSDINKILNIQNYVISSISGSHLSQKYIGKEVRTIKDIYESNIATNIEKAFLCAAMIQHIGIDAQPVLAYNKQGLPIINNNNILVRVAPKKGEPIYIDPTHKNSHNISYKLSENNIVSLSTQEIIDDKLTELSIINFSAKIYLDKIVKGEAKLRLDGIVNPYLMLSEKNKKRDNLIYHLNNLIKESEIETLTSKTTEVNYKLNTEDYKFEELGSLKSLTLPIVASAITINDIPTAYKIRTKALRLPHTINESYKMVIEVPNNECININTNNKFKCDLGSVSVKVQNKNGNILIKKKLIIDKKVITPQQYNDFKKMMDIWFDKNNSKLYFK